MVFLDSFSMSSQKARQGPSPPSVEQILEDLSAASDDDVVFKSSILAEHATQSKGKTNNGASYSGKGGKSGGFVCFITLKIYFYLKNPMLQ